MAEMRLEQTIKQALSTEQRLALKQLLILRQELQTAPPPEALTGLEGIGEAHKLLQKKGLRGALIGSLALDILKTGDPASLGLHKDTDVAILAQPGEKIDLEEFEGGIDWWVPKKGRLNVREATGSMEGDFQWWENANGIVIGVSLSLPSIKAIPPGLHIPTLNKLIEMRVSELLARTDTTKVSIEDGTIEALNAKLEKELNPKHLPGSGIIPLSQFVPYRFQLGVERIPPEKIIELEIEGKDLRELVAINSRPKTK